MRNQLATPRALTRNTLDQVTAQRRSSRGEQGWGHCNLILSIRLVSGIGSLPHFCPEARNCEHYPARGAQRCPDGRLLAAGSSLLADPRSWDVLVHDCFMRRFEKTGFSAAPK